MKETRTKFLKDNSNVFAWSHKDMPRIESEVMVHKLNVDPDFKQVKQKRRALNLDRYEAIKKEVEKLLKARLIREVLYPN